MGSTAKNLGLRIATIFAAICITCVSVAAGDANDANKPPGEVPFEQRMQKKISVEFRSTPIEDVIRIMADQANVDIVKSPSVTGVVTCTLTDVPLEEALNNILSAHNYSYVLSQNMIRVITAADKTEKPEILQTQTYEIVYADIKEVVKALDKFKSKQGMVASIEGTSHIIVTDTESRIRDITKFIKEVDRMTAQILVEARIYDITSKENFDIGTDWHVGRNTPITDIGQEKTHSRTDTSKSTDNYTEKTITYDSLAGYDAGTPSEVEIIEHVTDSPLTAFDITNTDKKTKTTAGTWLRDFYGKSSPFTGGGFEKEQGGTIRFGVLNDAVDIEMALSILHKQVGAKLLANPRILVLDNEKATISIISEIPYQQLTESSLGGSMGTTAFKEVGVKLEVTPHLAERDQMIRLQLKPEFSVKTDEVTLQSTGTGLEYSQPVIDKRTADTKLLIKNGQTVVLGGLKKKETTQNIRKVPLLGDLPVLGNLFRSESEETINSEIVVFVTVWIIKQEPIQQAVMSPFMSQNEQNAYKVTEFKGPKPANTKAEKAGK